MDIHLSEEAARYIEAQLARGDYRSPSEFVELLLRRLRLAEGTHQAERHAWLQAQETAAAKIWDHDADARYDAL
jgi:Arc/MetJ-type ribon-helix-helix transcriptional regulator